MNIERDVARALLAINAVGFSLQNPITFKSGIKSPVYVDNRKFPFSPRYWRTILEGFSALIKERDISFDILAGIAVAGIPHSAALGFFLEKPSLFIRKEAKDHGTQKRIEGGDVRERRVLLIEDLVTTGSSSLSGVEALRDEKAFVEDCLVIISYGFEEAARAFDSAKVRLHSLTSFPVVLEEALSAGTLDAREADVVRDWLSDPYGWALRQGL